MAPERSRRRTSRRPVYRLGVCLLAGLALAGCSLAFQRPDVRVVRVALASLSFTGGTVEVVLEVVNPNRYALETRAFRYALSFPRADAAGDTTWVALVEEERLDTVRLPAGDTTRVPLRLPFDLRTVESAVGRLLREGELGYRFNGALRLQTPLGGAEVPFDERGIFRP